MSVMEERGREAGAESAVGDVELANLCGPTLAEVIDQAHRGIERVRQTPNLAYSFLRRDRPVGLMIHQPDTQDALSVAGHSI